ncbi:MAG: hypothetical protein RML94_06505 [Bacteroidia bacterium]|nr:hypothetical protein [Bacteroidia bacterium]
MGVSLRCARVGVLRAALRFGAAHRANARPSHASRKTTYLTKFIS